MIRKVLIICMLLAAAPLPGGVGMADSVNHYPLTSLARKFQDKKTGYINYQELKKDPYILTRYLYSLKTVNPEILESMPPEEKTALWLNAFNAGVLSQVIRHYTPPDQEKEGEAAAPPFYLPPRSVARVDGFWTEKAVEVSGKNYSLTELEFDVLRKDQPDPRLVFAMYRASKGGPRFPGGIYGNRLERMLDDLAEGFARDEVRVSLCSSVRELYVPELLRWFAGDLNRVYGKKKTLDEYGKPERGIVGAVCRFSTQTAASRLERDPYRLVFTAYDWALDEIIVKPWIASPPSGRSEQAPTIQSIPLPTPVRSE